MASTTVYQYIDTSGVIIPDTSNILADTQAEYQSVFGADLIVDPSSPQGVLITAESLARTAVVKNNAAVANQINPQLAGGIFLDAIIALTGGRRRGAKPSLVNAQLTGEPGTVIPALSQAQTGAGDVFQTLAVVTLAPDGTGSVQLSSVANGPIPCSIGALTQIVTPVLGWETVTNAAAASLGTLLQSDLAARATRNNTLAFQGISLPEAITSALNEVSGVQSLSFRENVAATTQTIDGISMTAHSIYVCVNGGSDNDVASALLENKGSGGGWNGDVSIGLIEPASGQAYTVQFDRTTVVNVLVRVTIAANTAPTNATADVVQAVLDYMNGNIEGEAGFVVGSNVSPFEISGAINKEFPGIYVRKVELSLASSVSYSTDEIQIAVNEIATTSEVQITVVTS